MKIKFATVEEYARHLYVTVLDANALIVRMSVATNLRRHEIGKLILRHLCEYAKAQGYQRVMLETTESWHEVIAFYQRFGFQITHYQDGDLYFALKL